MRLILQHPTTFLKHFHSYKLKSKLEFSLNYWTENDLLNFISSTYFYVNSLSRVYVLKLYKRKQYFGYEN